MLKGGGNKTEKSSAAKGHTSLIRKISKDRGTSGGKQRYSSGKDHGAYRNMVLNHSSTANLEIEERH
jgi:hypothetical protein